MRLMSSRNVKLQADTDAQVQSSNIPGETRLRDLHVTIKTPLLQPPATVHAAKSSSCVRSETRTTVLLYPIVALQDRHAATNFIPPAPRTTKLSGDMAKQTIGHQPPAHQTAPHRSAVSLIKAPSITAPSTPRFPTEFHSFPLPTPHPPQRSPLHPYNSSANLLSLTGL